MKLRMLSVAGEALNFAARRMETIIRVAWLPVTLMLVANMATVFAALSVANSRLITFADLARAGVPFERAAVMGQQALWQGVMSGAPQMLAVWLAAAGLNMLLVASFMAPLIRYAGLGERPAPGVVRLAFGADQIRYLLSGVLAFAVMAALAFAPIGAAFFYVTSYVSEALSVTQVSFPNPESLHTIKLVTAGERLTESGEIWKYTHALPLVAAAPFALLLWGVLIAHFHPKNRPDGAGPANFIRRAIVTLLGGAVLVLALWQGAVALAGEQADAAYLAIAALIAVIVLYVNLRVTPYPGVAVCRRSLAPAGTLKVTRGWNIARLAGDLLIVLLLIVLVAVAVNRFVLPAIGTTVNYLYYATMSATKLTNSGVEADWVRPLWTWVWTGARILINLFVTFFSYGVIAGLMGRLYRESVRENGEATAPPPWRR